MIKKEFFSFSGMKKLGIVSLFGGFASAFISTIWALYMNSFVNSVAIVGLISGALAFISFISYFVFIPIIERNNKSRLFSYSLFLFGILYILFAINKNFYLFIFLAFIMNLLFTIRLTSFGIIVRDKSAKTKLSSNEGLLYTFANVAWVAGPLIAGWVNGKFGISMVFLLSAFFTFAAFALFKMSGVKSNVVCKKADDNIIKNFTEFFKNKNRVFAYLLSSGISFWWSLIYIFIPVYMVENGLGDMIVAYFLFAIPIPLILLEYNFGKLAGKIGFRKVFAMGFAIAALLCSICFFVTNIYWILGILVLASIGLAMLEPTSEAYFFDISKEKDCQRFYGPQKTAIDLGQFVAKTISGILLFVLAFKFLFIFFAIVMFGLFLLSLKMKDIVESGKVKKRK
jgi:MFS family permease